MSLAITSSITSPLLLSLASACLHCNIALAQQGAIDGHTDGSTQATVRAIASSPSSMGPGGIFVAEPDGSIYFLKSLGGMESRVALLPHTGTLDDLKPRGMAFNEPFLYVYDGNTRKFWTINREHPLEKRTLRFDVKFSNPSHFAVSPSGLVAVVDEGRLLFLQEDREAVEYQRSEAWNVGGVAFTAWDTLQVLDRRSNSLVTIVLRRFDDGRIVFRPEEVTRLPASASNEWRAIDVADGIVHIATSERVFALVDGELIPALPQGVAFSAIKDLAISPTDFYVKDGPGLKRHARTIPVDFHFEDEPVSSQATLLRVYEYLFGKDLMPLRQVHAEREFQGLDEFLQAQDVLILGETSQQSRVTLAPDARKWAYQASEIAAKRARERSMDSAERLATSAGNTVMCAVGSIWCNSRPGDVIIPSGTGVLVPDVQIKRSLSRERVVLSQAIELQLNRTIPSTALRETVSAETIKKFNPAFSELSDSQVLALDVGTVELPVERWTLTTAVPIADVLDHNSALWKIQEISPQLVIRSRAAFTEQSAKAAINGQAGAGMAVDGTDKCLELKKHRDAWFEHIRYPFGPDAAIAWPKLASAEVRVGVLEYGSTVLQEHEVFSQGDAHPAWYTASSTGELSPVPGQSMPADGLDAALDAASFATDANHGTHVSALIAGRNGSCWAGLLPNARLVLVDLTDSSRVQQTISNAIRGDVGVFNVSQVFPGVRKELHDTIKGDGRAVWIVAAGNRGDDLDDIDIADVPAPARWGDWPNIVVVTASDWQGALLPTVVSDQGNPVGANRGKGFVDLIAPGKDVVSASELKKFGLASGTSQAVPHVSAAAAMLADKLGTGLTPGDIKARLIASAIWVSDYEDLVWGGRLDFGAAVAYPDLNILRTTNDVAANKTHSVEIEGDPEIEILNTPKFYERGGSSHAPAPSKVRFSHILSLRRQPGGTHRVVLRDAETGRMKIILKAQLGDPNPLLGGPRPMRCTKFEVFDAGTGVFKADDRCEQGIPISSIDFYLRGHPYGINWE